MKPKELDEIKKMFDTGDTFIPVKDAIESLEKTYRPLDPTTKIQMFLAYFTAFLILLFLGAPFLLFVFGILAYAQFIELIIQIWAILGFVVGAVWGYYFHSIQKPA